jgi:hypothetical protein
MKIKYSNTIDSVVNVLPRTIFIGSVILYISYFVLYWGLFSINKDYVNYIHVGVQIIISLFLIIRFHPFRNHVLEVGDSAVIFSSAMFLLTSLGVTQYTYYITADKLKNVPVLNKIITNNTRSTLHTTSNPNGPSNLNGPSL